jgi:hypothetical protein
MNGRSIFKSAVISLVLFSSVANAAIETKGIPTFTDSKKEITHFNTKFFKGAKRIIIPTATVKVSVAGAVGGTVSRGGNVAKAKAKFVVTGADKTYLQAISKKAYEDAVAKFRAAGWEVLTFDDVKSEPDVTNLAKFDNDEKWAMPLDREGGLTYAIAFPSDEMNMKGGFTGLHAALRGLAKEKEAVVFIPSYTLITPQFWVETSRGYKSSSIGVNNAPGVTVMPSGFYCLFINHKGAGGAISNSDQYVHLADNAGVLEKVDDKSPTFANGLGEALSHLTGAGKINKGLWIYSFALNTEVFESAVLTTIGNFNAVAAKGTAEYIGK